MRDYDISSDLRNKTIQKKLRFKQFDNGSTIKVKLYEDSEKVAIETGWTIKANFKRADREKYDRDVSGISDNTFLVTLDSTVTAVVGDLLVDFKITYGDKQVTTFTISLEIEESVGEGNSGDIGGNTGGDVSVDVDLSAYQKKTDNTLNTTDKTIVGAINEVRAQFQTIANQFTTEQVSNKLKLKFKDTVIFEVPLNGLTQETFGNIVVDVTNLQINEGGTGIFTVALDNAPTNEQIVNVASDNTNVIINPSTLTFSSSNYNIVQTITVTSVEDDIEEDYNANITLSNSNVDSVTIATLVKDNDGVNVVIPTAPDEVTPLSDFTTEYISGNPKLYLTGYTGTNPTVRVASNYTTDDGKTPTSYYYGLFKGNTTIENVFFDDGVQFHKTENYEWCTALKYVQKMFSGNLNRTFLNCTSLQSAPDFVETTDETALYTFDGCTSLQETPDMSKATTLKKLSSTFNGCTSLRKAIVPSRVTVLSNTFNGCTSLKSVTIQGSECEIDFNATDLFGNTGQEIKIKAPKNSNTIANLQKYIHNCKVNFGNLNIFDLDDNELLCISCWGDSLTKSPENGVDTYPKTLLEKVGTNAVIYNFGVAGDFVDTIAQRQQTYPSRKNDIQVIWVGTNKDWDSNDDLISKINAMINYSTSNKYIIIGLLKRYASDELDNAMQSAFGEHFLNIRNYMITSGLTDANISATEQDNTDISNGVIPTSLMQDKIHLNATGQILVGNQLYNKLVSLGYITAN